MQTVVVRAGDTVSVVAEMKIYTGKRDEHGQRDVDANSTSTVVRVAP